ncbi:Aste57867_24487 [Aphanomyces stellatus]|uniref:Aste57867_24487 protein n=1 Tax=Aphanomyces stellatus TaxID=120398 RepID=A0A485LRL8_9STRA|nr:hypothetical protein As57867_024410 [Aphanomyces stellatus]VFU01126.1 Aste57867_24487 [Aphanomyces stellatus]
MAATCSCVVSLEVILGPETGKVIPPVAWDPSRVIAVGRSKKFVHGKAGENTGLLLALDLDVSSRHAQMIVHAGVVVIRDCKSTNGTKVNDAPLPPSEMRPLKDGDTVSVGSSLLVYRVLETCGPCVDRANVDASILAATQSPAVNAADDFEMMQPAKAPPPPTACIVCGDSLWGMDTTERQVHVNQCLDGKKAKGKWKKPSSIEQEQLNLAIAISKSTAGEIVECDVTRAMLEREIQDIDAQMDKLRKRREKLVRRLQKNDKQSQRVTPSAILPPSAVVDWDPVAQLAMLFPPSRARPPHDLCVPASSSRLWQMASGAEGDNVYLVPCFVQYDPIPPCLPSIFPKWEENLAFMETKPHDEIQSALARLQTEMAVLAPRDPTIIALAFFERRMQWLLRRRRENDVPSRQVDEEVPKDESVPDVDTTESKESKSDLTKDTVEIYKCGEMDDATADDDAMD